MEIKEVEFGGLYAEPSRNGIYKSSEFQGSGTRIVNMGEVFGYEFISDQEMSLINLTTQELSVNSLKDGDLLFGRRSVVPSGAGKCSLVVAPSTPLVFESSIIRVRLNSKRIIPKFYYYFFSSPAGRKIMSQIISGTNIKGIRGSELRDLKVPVPCREEQEAVANALSDADTYIESLEKLIAKKRLIKKGVMQELLTGKRRLKGFTTKWEITSLNKFGFTYGGLIGKTKNDFGNGTAKYVTFLNIMNHVVIDPHLHENVNVLSSESQNCVCKNDLLFNGSSETPEEVAFCAYVDRETPNLFLNSFCFGFRPTSNAISGKFLAYFFRGESGRELIKSLAQGATRYNISKISLLKAEFQLPAIAEQEAIAEVLSDIDKEIIEFEQILNKVHEIKNGMMQELLTGRIRLV